MFINQHYKSYREEVSKDAFPGYAEYASKLPTKDTEKYPTFVHYLKYINSVIQDCINGNNEEQYYINLANHQDAIFQLFQRMFFEEANTISKHKDETKVLDMVEKYGWRVFKFSGLALIFDKMIIIPRYHANYLKEINSGIPCFNADEMDIVMKSEPHIDIIEEILVSKKKNKSYLNLIEKDTSGAGVIWSHVNFSARNQSVVTDWTGKLR